MNNLNISHPVVLVPIETIESANESGNCNVFQEGVTCTVCARLNSGRMGELRAPFEVLQAIIFVHFYYCILILCVFFALTGLDDTSSVKCTPYETIAVQTRTHNSFLLRPAESSCGYMATTWRNWLRLLSGLVVLYWTTDLNALSLTRGFQITQKTWGSNCVK